MQDQFRKEFLAQRCLSVRVIPNAKKNQVVGKMENGVWKIRICAPAKEGRANAELIDFMNRICGKKFRILSGKTSRLKTIQIFD